ncbi:hypothetical protein IW140_004067 [Coemansia sp. RSA 1813]|nr:hypothetical protein EV178_003051 [Coemansia sp. RSA 1646]KAJ1766755.1 hypothetical protein LPJ74_005727 [Coemansia sp. RSA 1843]KAJ2089396.1 hypothetical protein IW138_003426 [Coemansia sp. RSA 986]KAJ2210565.1 hypothetical protein EV179_006145 [Coemansia sp. RSA 487]KAJ2568249.1 hypothetical protein IW140_004067 [Coemansia sp. RSA 1813]
MFRNVLSRTSATSRFALGQQARNLACSTVYIKKLPRDITKETLTPYVEKFGPIYDVTVRDVTPSDYHGVAFVKYYVGKLPSSVEELVQMPFPTPAEIDEVTQISASAIEELNKTEIGGEYLIADHARRNKADSIQFYARYTMQKANNATSSSRSGPPLPRSRTTSERQNYTRGYQEGFKDGIAEGKRLSQNST